MKVDMMRYVKMQITAITFTLVLRWTNINNKKNEDGRGGGGGGGVTSGESSWSI